MFKICSKCNINKDLKEFSKDKTKFDGIYSSCKVCKSTYNKIYVQKEQVKEVKKLQKQTYRTFIEYKNKEKIYRKDYEKNRLATDPFFRLKKNLRSRISHFISRKSIDKNNSCIFWLGCSPVEFKIHLESKFQTNMTWNNYGLWTIDHVIPLSRAESEIDLIKLSHYSNLQPMWALDNIKKGNK